MRHLLTATAAGFLVLIFTTTAPAQQFGSGYSGGSYYSVPSGHHHHHHQHYQPVYPSTVYTQPQFGGSSSYSTPSFGFGINVNPSYGSNYGNYTQPRYVPNYYQNPSHSSWQGQYHPYHHHYGQR